MTEPARRRVMSPQTRAALGLPRAQGAPARPAVSMPASGEDAAALAVTMRVQRNLALRTMTLLLGGLVLLAVVLAVAPNLSSIRIASVPLVWIVLGAAVYPLLLLLAARHRRSVDQLEQALLAREARRTP